MAQFVQTLNLDHPMSQAVALEAAVNFFDEENHKTQLDVSDNLNSSLEKNREIRTTSIVKKIEEQCQQIFTELAPRVNTLLQNNDDEPITSTPFSPACIAVVLKAVLHENSELKINEPSLIKRAEDIAPLHMKKVYTKLSKLLSSVPNNEKSVPQKNAPESNPAIPEQNSLEQQEATQHLSLADRISERNNANMQLLEKLINIKATPPDASPIGSADYAELIQGIGLELEINRQAGHTHSPYDGLEPYLSKLPRQMSARFDALELLFEGITTHPLLTSIVCKSIQKLRIPFMQIALEGHFLTESAASAQRLLDGIIHTGMALEENAPEDNPLRMVIEDVTSRIANAPLINAALLDKELGRFLNITRTQEAQMRENLSKYLTRAEEFESQEANLLKASTLLDSLLQANTPAAISELFKIHWVFLLAHSNISVSQADNPAWTLAQEISQAADAAQKKESLSNEAIENLIKKIDENLKPFVPENRQRETLLSLCSKAFTKPTPPASEHTFFPSFSAVEQESGLSFFGYTGYSSEHTPPKFLSTLEVGDWLSIGLPDGRIYRGEIYWFGVERNAILLGRPYEKEGLIVSMRCLSLLEKRQAVLHIRPSTLVDDIAQTLIDMLPSSSS